MSIPKIISLLSLCALLAVSAASARDKHMPIPPVPPSAVPDSTAESEERFDSYLEQLIARLQSNIEESIDGKRTNNDKEDWCDEMTDSLDAIIGDYSIARDETVNHDLYIRNGSLTVEGLLDGNGTVVNGDITVRSTGRITGNAHAINGSVYRDQGGIVNGDIHESSTSRTGFFKRYLEHRSGYSFAPRWLHENIYSEGPVLRYNRVEGVYLGLSSAKKFYWDGKRIISGYGSVGYGFKTHRWRGQLGLDRQFAGSMGLFEFGGEGHNLTDTRDDWILGQTENTLAAILFKEDYRDYFQRAGFSAHTAWYTKSPNLSTMINAEYRYDEYESLSKNTNWSVFKNKDAFRENPPVTEGTMRSIAFTAGLSTVGKEKRTTTGWNTFAQVEFGTFDRTGRVATTEFPATPDLFEKDFTRAIVDVRRYQPLSRYDNLNVRIRLGSLKGGYLEQKGFDVGGVNTLPAFGFKEFAGNRMVLANVEYALNGSVFNDIDFWPGFLTAIIFADGGDARFVDTKADVTDGFKGFALNNMKSDFGFAFGWHDGTARLGFAWRTDKSAPPMVFFRLSKPF